MNRNSGPRADPHPHCRTPGDDGRDPEGVSYTECLRSAEKSGWPSHSTWVDDFVLVAEEVGDLDIMRNYFDTVGRDDGLRLAKHSLHRWTCHRPEVAGSWFVHALHSLCMGGVPRPKDPLDLEELLHVDAVGDVATPRIPCAGLGTWGWLWGATTKSWGETTVTRMVRLMLGHSKLEGEGRMSWHTLTLREAKAWALSKLGSTYVEWMLGQCAGMWEQWLCRRDRTFLRRMMAWQSAEHCAWKAELAVACRRRSDWRHLAVGRRPRHWEAHMVAAFGAGWRR